MNKITETSLFETSIPSSPYHSPSFFRYAGKGSDGSWEDFRHLASSSSTNRLFSPLVPWMRSMTYSRISSSFVIDRMYLQEDGMEKNG